MIGSMLATGDPEGEPQGKSGSERGTCADGHCRPLLVCPRLFYKPRKRSPASRWEGDGCTAHATHWYVVDASVTMDQDAAHNFCQVARGGSCTASGLGRLPNLIGALSTMLWSDLSTGTRDTCALTQGSSACSGAARLSRARHAPPGTNLPLHYLLSTCVLQEPL